jgi:hypothetical protein
MSRRTEAHVHWKHLLFYGVAVAIVVLIGGVAIWSFIEKQSLVIQPEPLPKVTVVTADPNSRLAAAWVTFLNRAEMSPTLVPLEKFDPIEGVVVFCQVPEISPQLADLIGKFVHRGGAVAFVGIPPKTAIGDQAFSVDIGTSDPSFKLSETVSPILARVNPGYSVKTRRGEVAFLRESPRMVADARWSDNARAAIVHMESAGGRYLWFGFNPDDLVIAEDVQLMTAVKSAFRWAAGQPISDGAVGAPQVAKTLTPDARRRARPDFSFTVDRMKDGDTFRVTMTNKGQSPLANPTVKIWLPPSVTEVALAGDLIMRRNATLTSVPGEAACLVSLPSLARNEQRMLKLKVVKERTTSSRAQRGINGEPALLVARAEIFAEAPLIPRYARDDAYPPK